MAHMPESVKSVRAGLSIAAGGSDDKKFEFKLADDEVMVLLSFYYRWNGVAAAGNNVVKAGLWRKTDAGPPGSIAAHAEDQDMVWNDVESFLFVTESIKTSGHKHVVLPFPLILIRAPRLLISASTITSLSADMRLFYLLREVSTLEMAKLMVKDHA